MKFDTGKCSRPAPEEEDPQAPGQAGAEQLESRLAEKDLGALMGTKLTMNQQCALVAKQTNSLLGCIRLGRLIKNQKYLRPLTQSCTYVR